MHRNLKVGDRIRFTDERYKELISGVNYYKVIENDVYTITRFWGDTNGKFNGGVTTIMRNGDELSSFYESCIRIHKHTIVVYDSK